jgi:hypothetical protein
MVCLVLWSYVFDGFCFVSMLDNAYKIVCLFDFYGCILWDCYLLSWLSSI